MKTKLCFATCVLLGFVSGTVFGAASSTKGTKEACDFFIVRKLGAVFLCRDFKTRTTIWQKNHVLSDEEMQEFADLGFVRISLSQCSDDDEAFISYLNKAVLQRIGTFYNNGSFDVTFWIPEVLR